MLKSSLAAGAFALALASPAMAQTYHDSNGTTPQGFVPLVGCSAGGNCAGPVSSTNPMPITGSFSATLSGFTPGGAYAPPLAVSTTSANVALPAGTVVIVYNTGATAAFVKLGASGVTATPANDAVPAGGWMAFTVGSNSYLAAITASGTTSLNLSGGSGLPTGSGVGSGGGGGSGAQGTAASASGAWPFYLTSGGAANTAANGLFVNPASGATFPVAQSGSTGADYSVNKPALPNVGANFGAGGAYPNYVLIQTVPASAARVNLDIENVSGAQIAVILDDGTASGGSAPANASVFALGGGGSAGSQGGSWTSLVEKGRVQIYAPLSSAQVMVRAN